MPTIDRAPDDDIGARPELERVPTQTDLVVEEFARSEADLVERVGSLEHDRAIYADLAATALDQVAAQSVQLDRMAARVLALVTEVRGLRQALAASEAARRAQEQGS